MNRTTLQTLLAVATAIALPAVVAFGGSMLVADDDLAVPVTDDVRDVRPRAATQLSETTNSGLFAGASRIDIRPRPDDYGGSWRTEGCATLGDDAGLETLTHVPHFDQSPWPEAPDCLYMGGYGIGPMHPITAWDDEHGLHVRSVAIGDGDDTVVLTLIDAVYYLGRYREMCDGCGALDLADRLGEELGIDPAGVFIAATHSHTAPDLIGGWGGVPDWYLQQVSEAIEDSIREAVTSMRPAVLEIGEEFAREFNAERRDTYRSAEEPGLSWVRALAADGSSPAGGHESGDPRPGRGRPAAEPEVIATVAGYAAHPVTRSAGSGIAHGDWPAVFAAELERQGSGVAMAMATGLGNLSPRHLHDHGGTDLAAELPDLGTGERVDTADVAVAAHRWTHPVTNPALTALALPGFFDRPFDAGPASVDVGTHDADRCVSASAVGVATQVNAARIGPLVVTGAPGETFANLSNTLKERNPRGVTLPLAMVNDGLGYIVQSFEIDELARTGAGFVAGDLGVEYEDAYAIDGCFGDAVLEETLRLLDGLGG